MLVKSNFSFSHSVLKRLVMQTHKNLGLFWKELICSVQNAFTVNFFSDLLTSNILKIFRISPDFRIFACQRVRYMYFSIFSIEIAEFERLQGFRKNLTCTHASKDQSISLILLVIIQNRHYGSIII